MKPDLSVNIAGIIMQNPVMNAAGTFDVESEPARALTPIERMGAFVQKSITLNPREGNPQPRIYETPAGMINRIGLQNVGVWKFVEEKLAVIYRLLPSNVPLIVSVAGESMEEYLETALILAENSKKMIAALEINVSCPNVADGLVFGSDPDLLFKLVRGLKSKVTTLPLIIKLTPNVTDITLAVKAAAEGGADALSLINTLKAKAFIRRGPNAGQFIEGGLSGPAIRAVALERVDKAVKAVDIPVVGMGGISNFEDALDFFRVGAAAIAVGTAIFSNPLAIANIVEGLEQHLTKRGYSNIAELK